MPNRPARRRPSPASITLKRDMQNAARQRSAGGARVWVRAHESDGHLVRGHWRDNPSTGGTVLNEDYQQHVQGLLSAHAAAVQRADAIRAALTSYARGLTG